MTVALPEKTEEVVGVGVQVGAAEYLAKPVWRLGCADIGSVLRNYSSWACACVEQYDLCPGGVMGIFLARAQGSLLAGVVPGAGLDGGEYFLQGFKTDSSLSEQHWDR